MGLCQAALILYGLAYQVIAAPSPKNNDDADTPPGIPPLLTFKDGNIGVNFFGFKASAGLGGLLTGDMSQGGLHAEAETPFGQKAGAGLGGRVDGNGRSVGGLYAGATAGGGIGASAGLDGVAGADGSAGRSYAGASAGGVGRTVIKETYGAPPGASSISGSLNIQKIAAPPSTVDVEVIKEKDVPNKSKVAIEIEKQVAAQPPPKKTYVERTVIPNYVEKTIQVPSYVEKTIRVPTVVEKTIKVPAPPTIIEQEVEAPPSVKTVTRTKQVVVNPEFPEGPTTIVKTRTKFHRRPWLHVRKYLNINSAEVPPPPPPYYGGVVATGAGADAAANSVIGSYGDFGVAAGKEHCCAPPPTTYTATVRKQFNGNLVRDIFNIPIATLGAVSNLVGNIAGGAGGSVSVSKSIGTAYKK
ncbi:unnamed protein product [Ceutorhynchus assimilis]|uniref:Uncharacterized protein n=1 Tax=Ceutorhynchus assimilis TaxID=467358 RepID=A0A9N9QLF1_9CUCU|nr:unnamed protein product [Ceutorhynchus assimilis]